MSDICEDCILDEESCMCDENNDCECIADE
jgi:hypothetical protein